MKIFTEQKLKLDVNKLRACRCQAKAYMKLSRKIEEKHIKINVCEHDPHPPPSPSHINVEVLKLEQIL